MKHSFKFARKGSNGSRKDSGSERKMSIDKKLPDEKNSKAAHTQEPDQDTGFKKPVHKFSQPVPRKGQKLLQT